MKGSKYLVLEDSFLGIELHVAQRNAFLKHENIDLIFLLNMSCVACDIENCRHSFWELLYIVSWLIVNLRMQYSASLARSPFYFAITIFLQALPLKSVQLQILQPDWTIIRLISELWKPILFADWLIFFFFYRAVYISLISLPHSCNRLIHTHICISEQIQQFNGF